MGSKGVRGTRLLNLTLAVAATVAGSMLAQTTPSAPVVLFRLVLPRAVMCVGDRDLEVESELRNISDHRIALSPAGIRAQVTFTNRACSLDDGFRSNTISTDPAPGSKGDQVVMLAPGESYRQMLKLELDHDFFLPGVYRVQIGYSGRYGVAKHDDLFVGTVNSNEALFEIGGCAPSPARKP